MLARMTARKFQEWKAFWELEPFGDEWRQTGVSAAASVSPHVKKTPDPETYMPPTRGIQLTKAKGVWRKVTEFLFKKKESINRGTRRGN